MNNLFTDFLSERNPTTPLRFIGIKRFNIYKAVLISIVCHFILVLFLYLSSLFSPDLVSSINQEETLFNVIAKNSQIDSQLPEIRSEELARIVEYEEILKRIRIQDSSLKQVDRSQLTDGLLDTLAALQKGFKSLEPSEADLSQEILSDIEDMQLSSGTKLFKAPQFPGKNQIKFYALEKEKSEAFNKLSDKITATKEDFFNSGQRVIINLKGGDSKTVPASYFFRESPYEEILAQGADLFYIVTGFPNIYKKLDQSKKGREAKIVAEKTSLDQKMMDVFLVEKSSQGMVPSNLEEEYGKIESKKTQIDIRNIGQILDDLMTLPELVQLENFRNNYLNNQVLDDPNLIELIREFTSNNLSSIMFEISDITSAFDYLEEIYFNKALDHLFYMIWLNDPSSEIGVEFLLCIANHVKFEKNGLYFLQKAYGEAENFLSQKYQREEMFNKRQKCFVIKDVYEDLVWKLPALGYQSIDEVMSAYQEVEIGVYNLLLDLGEDAKNMGLYELGRFAWENEEYKEALAHWNDIDKSYSTNSLRRIRKVISRNQSLSLTILDIDSSLNWTFYGEQRAFIDRLVKFGKWKNRYKEE